MQTIFIKLFSLHHDYFNTKAIFLFLQKKSYFLLYLKLSILFLQLDLINTLFGDYTMKFDNKAIAEAAYYIWQNNGCPANTQAQDWAAAISQLSAMSAVKSASKRLATKKSSLNKSTLIKAAALKSASSKTVSLRMANNSKNTSSTKKTSRKSK